MTKKLTNVLLLLVTSLLWLLIGWTLHSQFGDRAGIAQGPAIAQIDKALTLLQSRQYITHEVTTEELSYAAIRGMVTASKDPYALLFTPPASAAYAADIAGETGAPGIWKTYHDKKIVIYRLTPEGGAERAGLQVGDILLGVDGIQFNESTSVDEVTILLRGPVGTAAKVVVQRGQAILEYQVTRDEWPIIASHMISGQIGYLQQELFPLNADKTMQQHLQTLVDQHMHALIWDLRDNGGGTVQATAAILNHFLAKGVFFIAEFKNGERQQFSADGNATIVDLPLVVLINEGTYSAGEMAASALAVNQRAILIGAPTKGKGLIQDVIPLDEQLLLRISIAKWLSPSGEWIEGKGVTPTIAIKDDPATTADEVLDFAVQYLLEHSAQ